MSCSHQARQVRQGWVTCTLNECPPRPRKARTVMSGKFAMTIIGAHLIGFVPRWVDGAQVACRSEKERDVVVEYAGKADLRVAWVDNVATISF